MISTKRLASLAVSIVENLDKFDLQPTEKQEVIFLAGQLAMIEEARAKREAAQKPPAPEMPHVEDEAA